VTAMGRERTERVAKGERCSKDDEYSHMSCVDALFISLSGISVHDDAWAMFVYDSMLTFNFSLLSASFSFECH